MLDTVAALPVGAVIRDGRGWVRLRRPKGLANTGPGRLPHISAGDGGRAGAVRGANSKGVTCGYNCVAIRDYCLWRG